MKKQKISQVVFDKGGEQVAPENQIFYRLSSPDSAKVEGHAAKVSIFLIFAVIWAVGVAGITVANAVTGERFETPAVVLLCVFAVIGAGFVAFGIYDQRRQLRANAEERKLLADCLCTDGKIEKCTVTAHRRSGSNGTSVSYEVSLTYAYTDLTGGTARGVHSAVYSADPEFYMGQYVMVAFNNSDSRILSRFKFVKEDERAFHKNEAARSDDDFDGLSGKTVKCNPKTVKSAEMPHVWFWAAVALFIFIAAYTVPMSVLVVPQLVTGNLFPDILVIPIIYLMPALLSAADAYFLYRCYKGRNKLKVIMKNGAKFTHGKIFASEKTYRGGAKQVVYCYIDSEGNRHTEVLKSPYYRKTVQDKAISAIIAYDGNGNSVPLG